MEELTLFSTAGNEELTLFSDVLKVIQQSKAVAVFTQSCIPVMQVATRHPQWGRLPLEQGMRLSPSSVRPATYGANSARQRHVRALRPIWHLVGTPFDVPDSFNRPDGHARVTTRSRVLVTQE